MSTTLDRRGAARPLGAGTGAPSAGRQLSRWSHGLVLAGILAISLIALPASAVAGGPERESSGSADGGATIPDVQPGGKSTYKPKVVGLARYRNSAAGRSVTAPGNGQVECPVCDPLAPYRPEDFKHPTKIHSPWFPLQPGKQLVMQGQANRGGGLLEHHVIFTVTDLIKMVNGIPCVVVWDQDINQGVLSESELAFFAIHDNGDVYLAGEYPEEYYQGQFISAENTWITGIEWARAGVNTPANPVVGGPGWEQANAPENDFWDCGKAVSLVKEPTCVPAGCFKDILTIREWAPLDGCDVIQVKTYAKGIGVIQVGAIDDPEGETLVLVEMNQLNDKQMDAARAAAIALDTHGYQVNEHYFLTQPVFRSRANDPQPSAAQALGPAAGSGAFLAVGRNPFKGSAEFSYGVEEAGPVELDVFDVVGRKIRSVVSETQAAGIHRAQWDGRDEAGNVANRGMYFARLRTAGQVVRKTLVLGN